MRVDAFRTRVHNYCVVTGRARGVYRDVKVSRIVFRNLAAEGLFFGLKKHRDKYETYINCSF